MMGLTMKQEIFCRAFVECGNASEAYRTAYNAAGMKQTTIANRASELLKNGYVSAMIANLRAESAKRHEITVDDLIKELEEARLAALGAETPQSSAAAAATMGKAKLLGLDKQLVEVTGKNGAPFIAELVFVRPTNG